MTNDTAARLNDVNRSIETAWRQAGGKGIKPILIAVSKTFDAEHIVPAIEAGQRVFGENRVQEATKKWPALKERYPDIELHLIGPLQTNKVRDALALFDVIHTLDREKLARAIAKEQAARGGRPKLFVEVNTGSEPQKAGAEPGEVAALVERARALDLDVTGLMCIPPMDEEAAVHFALLEKLAGECGLEQLSMGMSADFETAIAFGATHVRVGSAIFGPRTPKA